ncbi:MAG: 30S ribosomal protein S20 [Nitrospinae bacterium]|nr:30S ribosomal protein S20 [Nitrospinota bacterium]
MANHKSADKRARQNKRRQERNMAIRSACRTAVKKARAAIESGDKAKAAESLLEATKTLDGSVTRGISHRKNASRRVSRLAHQVNLMK